MYFTKREKLKSKILQNPDAIKKETLIADLDSAFKKYLLQMR